MNSDGTDNLTDNKPDAPVGATSAADNNLNENINPPVYINSSEPTITRDEEPIKPPAVKNEYQSNNKPSESSAVKKPKKFPLLHSVVQTAVGIGVGAGFGYLLLYLVIPGLLTASRLIYALLFLILSLFLNLNLYKLGQLIAGCACGGKITSYQFTCLRIYRSGEKLRRRITLTHFFEGQCALLPPSSRPYPSNIYIAFYTGGVTACAFAGCLCIITAICLSVTASGTVFFSEQNVPIIMFLWINGIFALLYAAACLIPVFWGDSPSDGSILSALIKKNPYTAHLIKLRAVTAQLTAGIRPSDLFIPVIIPVSVTKKKNRQKAAFSDTAQKKPGHLFLQISDWFSDCFRYLCRLFISLRGRFSDCFRRLPFFKSKKDLTGNVTAQLSDSSDVVTAAEILDILQADEPQDNSADNVAPEINEPEVKGPPVTEKPAAETLTIPEENRPAALTEKKKKITLKTIFNISPRGKYMGDFEIKKFTEPKENDNNLSACSLLLKIYKYYIALDNAERGDMQTYIRQIEENIIRVPRQLLPRICRELCFYYSIDKNPASAEHYMEMLESLPKQKDCIDDMRMRAYFEMYIKRRHKIAFSMCRDALETAGSDTSNGLTVMNTELIQGLVILIHQKSAPGKNEA